MTQQSAEEVVKARADAVPPHPVFGKPLSGAPKTVGGVTFRPYRTGIGTSARISDDHRAHVWRSRKSWRASVDGEMLPTHFRYEGTAYAAVVKTLAQKAQP